LTKDLEYSSVRNDRQTLAPGPPLTVRAAHRALLGRAGLDTVLSCLCSNRIDERQRHLLHRRRQLGVPLRERLGVLGGPVEEPLPHAFLEPPAGTCHSAADILGIAEAA
jgi:hypothetical protein